jgi:hypothetical protein
MCGHQRFDISTATNLRGIRCRSESQAVTRNEPLYVWLLQRVQAANSALNKPAGFWAASDENESSTEFPNGGRNPFPNAPKNPRENKAVSLKNSAR